MWQLAQKNMQPHRQEQKRLYDFFLYDQTQFTTPSMLEHLIREDVNVKIKEAMRRQRHTLIAQLH